MKNVEIADAWFASHFHCDKRGLLALTGLRGTGKSSALERFRLDVRGRCAAEDGVFFVNCENRLLQRIRTGEQLWDFICASVSGTGRLYLFIDEASSFPDIARFFEIAFASGRCSFVCAAASSGRMLERLPKDVMLHECRLLPDGRILRTADQLERLWDTLFLRDVINGLHLVDVRAIECVADWTGDHMGDPASLRRIVADIEAEGCRLSPNTVASYLQSLQEGYLIERVRCWDAFERIETKTDYTFFCMDLELRRHRRGPAPSDEARRLRLALSYLQLRRRHGRVLTVRGGPPDADFVTFSDGRAVFWTARSEGPVPVL